MIVDLNKYTVNKKPIQDWYRNNKDNAPIGLMVSSMAVSTMCPCIVVAFYIGEVSGWPQEILESIERLTKFYDYTEVIGKPESYPI
jgi:hypothetical protein